MEAHRGGHAGVVCERPGDPPRDYVLWECLEHTALSKVIENSPVRRGTSVTGSPVMALLSRLGPNVGDDITDLNP